MEITKHVQSALILAKPDGGRLAVDLGVTADGPYDLAQLGALDAVLYTHQHADHLDPDVANALLDAGVELFGNADVCDALSGRPVTLLTNGTATSVAGWDVVPHDMPHVEMIDGSAGPPNSGLVFDGRLLHPGDGLFLEGVAVDVLAVPLAGPSVSLRDAYQMVERLSPTTAIPIHYDFFPADPERFKSACDLADIIVLGRGETTTV